MAQLSMDPRMKPYLDDPTVMAKIKLVQDNPSMMTTILSDPKMMEMLGLLMGQPAEESPSAPASASATKKKEPETPVEVVQDWSDLAPKAPEKNETEKKARLAKEKG